MSILKAGRSRITALILAFLMIFSFVSCNIGGASSRDTGHLDAFDYSAIPAFVI